MTQVIILICSVVIMTVVVLIYWHYEKMTEFKEVMNAMKAEAEEAGFDTSIENWEERFIEYLDEKYGY